MSLALAEADSTFRSDIDEDFTLSRAKWRIAARAKVSPLRVFPASPEIGALPSDAEQIYDAIQSFYLSDNRPRDRHIVDRITALHRDAIEEDERILVQSMKQFKDFFLGHSDLSIPEITLTPNGAMRARWIQGPGHFAAIEFTGKPLVKLIAEIPRGDGQTAQYFITDRIFNIFSLALSIGAPLA